jgi:hypothetical protein
MALSGEIEYFEGFLQIVTESGQVFLSTVAAMVFIVIFLYTVSKMIYAYLQSGSEYRYLDYCKEFFVYMAMFVALARFGGAGDFLMKILSWLT